MADEVSKLSGKLGLDTSDFKTALAAANRELRVLESGFKASAAALGDWTQDATGLENRAKSLTSQIEIQKLKVEALAAEHKRLAEENGENSRAAQDAEIKLNKETETLHKMEGELNNAESALEEMAEGEEEVGDEAEEASSKMDNFKEVMAGMGAIAGAVVTGILALGAAAVAAAAGIGAMVFSAAESAAELVDLSAQTGISTTRLQELTFIGDQVGTSLDTITGAQARLIRSMASAQDKTGEQAKAFQTLGVSVTDVNGNLRDQQQVFSEVIDALGAIENPAERDALAMQIFGKSAQELNPLIKAGSDELARLADEAHNVGAVMDEETVASLEAFDDSVSAIKAGIKGTLGTLAGQFVPAFQELATALQNLFKSEEFKKRIGEIANLIQGFVVKLVDVIQKLASGDLQGALAKIFGTDNAEGILNFINMIRDFIQNTLIPFVTEHAEEIKAALIGIGAALAAAGIAGVIAAIIAAINPVGLIIAAIVAEVGVLSAAWAGNWGGIRDVVTSIWEGFLKPTLEALWAFLSTTIPIALQVLGGFWTNTFLPAIQAVWNFMQTSLFPLLQAIGEFLSAVFSLYLRVLAGIWQNILLPALQEVWKFLQDRIFPIFQTIGDYVSNVFQPIFEGLADFINNTLAPAFGGISGAIQGVIDWLLQMAEMLNTLQLPPWLTPGSPTPLELGLRGISDAMQQLNQQIPTFASALSGVNSNFGRGTTNTSNTQNDSFNFFAPVILPREAGPGSLGSRLKGRRY